MKVFTCCILIIRIYLVCQSFCCKQKGVFFQSFLGRVVFQVPDWLHHLLMGARILFKNTLEMYTDYYLQCKLEQLFQEHRLVSLITLLRGLCFVSCLFHYVVCAFSDCK